MMIHFNEDLLHNLQQTKHLQHSKQNLALRSIKLQLRSMRTLPRGPVSHILPRS